MGFYSQYKINHAHSHVVVTVQGGNFEPFMERNGLVEEYCHHDEPNKKVLKLMQGNVTANTYDDTVNWQKLSRILGIVIVHFITETLSKLRMYKQKQQTATLP